MTILTPNTPAPAYSAAHITASAVDYTVEELEDLTGRKVEDVPISGDALTRLVRLRRGVAHVTRTVDDFTTDVETANDNADYGLWNGSQRPVPTRTNGLDANRRMAAVGFSNGPVGRRSRIITDGITPTVLD